MFQYQVHCNAAAHVCSKLKRDRCKNIVLIAVSCHLCLRKQKINSFSDVVNSAPIKIISSLNFDLSMTSGNPNTGYYDWNTQGGNVDPSAGAYSYDFGTPEFGTQPQFGQFDYDSSQHMKVPPAPVAPNQGIFYPPPSYSGSILTPEAPLFNESTTENFEDEPPLLEELGINFDHIWQKTVAVLNPLKDTDASILQETDLTGPLVFCLCFGGFLLLSGKIHFGYIYGIGVLGCLSMFVLLNLMSESGVSFGCTVSVLGYCLLPMVVLSGLSVLSLKGPLCTAFTIIAVSWCSLSASKLFVTALAMDHQQPLVAYPCALLYGVFALLTIF